MSDPIDQPSRQRFVTELERNFSVVASAGSGKTRAITDRIVQIALSKQARAWLPNLVVVTFTNRAADEMQHRARQNILEARVPPDVLAAFNRAFFGTIHSFCLKLLSNHGHYLGLPTKLDLVKDDEELWNQFVQRQTTIGRLLTEKNRAALLRHVQVRRLMELGRHGQTDALIATRPDVCPDTDFSAIYAYVASGSAKKTIPDLQVELRKWEQRWREGEGFIGWPLRTSEAKEFVALWREAFDPLRRWVSDCSLCVATEVQRDYRAFRLERGALTYDDQVSLANELMQHKEAARRIRGKNYRVLLDEAQDTDPQQFSVLLEVARPALAEGHWLKDQQNPPQAGHFCMVGDFQQSIYSDRADLGQYRRIHEALRNSGAADELEFSVTFRLDQKQVDCVNATFRGILNGLEGQVPFVELNPRPDALPGQVVRLDFSVESLLAGAAKPLTERARAEAEARELARWLRATGLKKLRARSWRDVAILCPRKKWLGAMAGALRREKFTVQIQSESELKADSPAYAWFTALSTIMAEPLLAYEIVGVLREVFGLSDHDLALFSEGDRTHFQIAEPTGESGIVAQTLDLLAKARAPMETMPLFAAAEWMVRQTQLRPRLTVLPSEDYEGLERELDALLASAAAAEAEGKTLAQFAEFLRANFGAERDVQPATGDAIQLITSHKAKGSEWQVVIVPFLSRRVEFRLGNYPRIIKTPGTGELVVALDREDMTQLKAELDRFDRQEMERLLYVALTRARHTLVLAFDHQLFTNAKGEINEKSQMRWLRGAKGESNAEAFGKLPTESVACSSTAAWQKIDFRASSAEQKVTSIPCLQRDDKLAAAASASRFIHKLNPSELAELFKVSSATGADPWKETDPELRPVLLKTPATRYGVWWHEFAQRLPWRQTDAETWAEIFEADRSRSPDPARSSREWMLLREHLVGASDFHRCLTQEKSVPHPELPFLWRIDDANCMEGIIDLALFDRNAARWLILDWKTNRVAPNELEILREQYRPQLAAYWRALSGMTGLPVEAAIYSTPTGALLRYEAAELREEWDRLLLERFS